MGELCSQVVPKGIEKSANIKTKATIFPKFKIELRTSINPLFEKVERGWDPIFGPVEPKHSFSATFPQLPGCCWLPRLARGFS